MNAQSPDWYLVDNIETVDTPALLVYPDGVERNIRMMVQMTGSASRLRPHVKTYKMPEVVRMQQAHGIERFKCATISEAEMLGAVGAAEVLLAYQPIGPKVARLVELVRRYPQTRFAAVVDNSESATGIASQFARAGLTIELLIDLNVGMDRTGIKPGPAVIELMRYIHGLSGVTLSGLHVYDGHIRDRDVEIRKRRCDEAFTPVLDLQSAFRELCRTDPLIVAGGSPTFPIHAKREGVECSPGTCLFWDWGYKSLLPDMEFDTAALVATRVISKIDEQTLCLDLGHKAIAAEKPFPRVHFLNASITESVAQSEEHLVVRVQPGRAHRLGQVLYGVPMHICPTVALYQEANVVRDHSVRETWRVVARDRRITV